MKKNSTPMIQIDGPSGVRRNNKSLHPRKSTIIKLCQLARSAFYVNPSLPAIVLN
ncbi:MAG: hypothetical protein J6C95_05595 [Muribaculaceae bacterium]|nr:hypothetical protein [Muribaculaceae bacterium]